jgi:hypothetical protein
VAEMIFIYLAIAVLAIGTFVWLLNTYIPME